MSPATPAKGPNKAVLQVTGAARYIDDLPFEDGLHAALVLSPQAHARILGIDTEAVAAAAPGAVVVTAADGAAGLLAAETAAYAGHPVAAVAAATPAAARAAAAAVVVRCQPLPAVLDVDAALAGDHFVCEPVTVSQGDPASELERADHRLRGRVTFGAQEHLYLECQVAVARPGADGTLTIVAAAQNPDGIRKDVAERLGRPVEAISVEAPRLGGGYGGKGADAQLVAGLAALLAAKAERPVRLQLDRPTDLRVTGKRPALRVDYDAGFDADGRLRAVDLTLAFDAGHARGMAPAFLKSAVDHVDNAYAVPHLAARAVACRTNRAPAAALRGLGAAQGISAIEAVMDHAARHFGIDGFVLRRRNLHRGEGRDRTPFGQPVEAAALEAVVSELAAGADPEAWRAAVDAFNSDNPVLRKGLALLPIRIGAANKPGADGPAYRHLIYGAAAAEVVVDRLTGEARVLRVEAVLDAGHPANPGGEAGQVEGGLVHGMGAMMSEELAWDADGQLLTAEPSAYPVPTSSAAPAAVSIRLLDNRPQIEDTVFRSLGGGDIGMALALSVWLAMRDAVAGLGPAGHLPDLGTPATPERVLAAVVAAGG